MFSVEVESIVTMIIVSAAVSENNKPEAEPDANILGETDLLFRLLIAIPLFKLNLS